MEPHRRGRILSTCHQNPHYPVPSNAGHFRGMRDEGRRQPRHLYALVVAQLAVATVATPSNCAPAPDHVLHAACAALNFCSAHGKCVDSVTVGRPQELPCTSNVTAACLCQPEWTGDRCDVMTCPHGCHGHGGASAQMGTSGARVTKGMAVPIAGPQSARAGVRGTGYATPHSHARASRDGPVKLATSARARRRRTAAVMASASTVRATARAAGRAMRATCWRAPVIARATARAARMVPASARAGTAAPTALTSRAPVIAASTADALATAARRARASAMTGGAARTARRRLARHRGAVRTARASTAHACALMASPVPIAPHHSARRAAQATAIVRVPHASATKGGRARRARSVPASAGARRIRSATKARARAPPASLVSTAAAPRRCASTSAAPMGGAPTARASARAGIPVRAATSACAPSAARLGDGVAANARGCRRRAPRALAGGRHRARRRRRLATRPWGSCARAMVSASARVCERGYTSADARGARARMTARAGHCGADGACSCHSGWFGPDALCRRASVTAPAMVRAGDVGRVAGSAAAPQGLCKCDPGWRGVGCELRSCPGSTSADGGVACGSGGCVECSGHGTCNTGTGACECAAPWSGESCSQHGCGPAGCGAHGKCVPIATVSPVTASLGRYACACEPGWTGADCSLRECIGGCGGMGWCHDGSCLCYPGSQKTDEGSCVKSAGRPRRLSLQCSLQCVTGCTDLCARQVSGGGSARCEAECSKKCLQVCASG